MWDGGLAMAAMIRRVVAASRRRVFAISADR
jgi:hypothetical protein